jgi:Bacterial sugar transferase
MSLIGPRPLLPEDQPKNTSIRLSVRPGISGWAQVNGAKLVTKGEKEKLDEWYIRNASLWLDLRIIMMTIKVVLVVLGRAWAPPRNPLCQLTARQGCPGRYRQVLGMNLNRSEWQTARGLGRARRASFRLAAWR